MKKSKLWICTALSICMLAGCGGFSPDETGVSVSKNGEVKSVAIENLDKDYYNEEELKNMIYSSVSEYNQGGEKVKMDSFEVKDKKATLTMEFTTSGDYASFNNVTFFTGTVSAAKSAGYDFNEEFLAVEKGKTKSAADTGTVNLSGDYKVVILEEPILVEVPGNIVYVSSNIEVTGKKEARMKAQEQKGTEGATEVQQTQASTEASGESSSGIPIISGVTQTEAGSGSNQAKLGYIVYE